MKVTQATKNEVLLATSAAVVLLVGCGGGSEEPAVDTASPNGASTPVAESRPPGPVTGGSKSRCPAAFADGGGRATCTIAQTAVELRECADRGPGGFDVRVHGISCREGRALRLPFSAPGAGFAGARDVIYRPWVAEGPVSDPTPLRPTGWTCRADYGRVDVQFTCWRKESVLVFKIG